MYHDNLTQSSGMPKASIIIRTFNEEKHLGSVLQALRRQTEQDHEVIIVDSGSTDYTLNIARHYGHKALQIKSSDFTFGYSLNVGCREATGIYLVILSAHAIPRDPQWLATLLEPFKEEKVAMTYGSHVGTKTTKFSERRDFEKYFNTSADRPHPLPYFANNANAAIRRELWQQYPFNEALTGLEDIAWARSMQEKGYAIRYVPAALAYHIHDEKWRGVYNRYRREAIAARHLALPYPPLARPNFFTFLRNIVGDALALQWNFSLGAFQDILFFRYYQWWGTRQGWYHAQQLNLTKERGELFFSGANLRVVVSDKNQARLEESPVPEIKPGEVLIKVAYTGVCATDVEVYEGALGYYQQGLAQYPITPGHEFSGTVARAGTNVKDFSVGDKVVGECVLSCRSCAHCESGSYAACKDRKEVGVMNYHGSYARFLVLPAMYVHHIPDGLDLKTAALVEPLAVVLRGLRRLGPRLKPKSRCAVVGAGPIGNLAAQVLTKYGHAVKVFNRRGARLQHLKDMVETSNTLEGLEHFDVIVEASGNPEALKEVLAQSRTDATILLLGFPYAPMNYNFEELVGQEKVVIGSVGGAKEDFEAALTILPTLRTGPFVQNVFPLAQFHEAWNAHRSFQHLKVLLEV